MLKSGKNQQNTWLTFEKLSVSNISYVFVTLSCTVGNTQISSVLQMCHAYTCMFLSESNIHQIKQQNIKQQTIEIKLSYQMFNENKKEVETLFIRQLI